MAEQTDLTRENAAEVAEAFDELFKKGVPKSRVAEFLGHANDIFLFLGVCQRSLPTEADAKSGVAAVRWKSPSETEEFTYG